MHGNFTQICDSWIWHLIHTFQIKGYCRDRWKGNKNQYKTSQRRVSQFAVLTSRNTRRHFVCRSATQERVRFDPESEEGEVFYQERHTSLRRRSLLPGTAHLSAGCRCSTDGCIIIPGFKMLKGLLPSHFEFAYVHSLHNYVDKSKVWVGLSEMQNVRVTEVLIINTYYTEWVRVQSWHYNL